MHDTNGDFPRFAFIIPDYAVQNGHQVPGRFLRAGCKSAAYIRFVFGMSWLEDDINPSRYLERLEWKIWKTLCLKSHVMKQMAVQQVRDGVLFAIDYAETRQTRRATFEMIPVDASHMAPKPPQSNQGNLMAVVVRGGGYGRTKTIVLPMVAIKSRADRDATSAASLATATATMLAAKRSREPEVSEPQQQQLFKRSRVAVSQIPSIQTHSLPTLPGVHPHQSLHQPVLRSSNSSFSPNRQHMWTLPTPANINNSKNSSSNSGSNSSNNSNNSSNSSRSKSSSVASTFRSRFMASYNRTQGPR